MWNVSPIWKEAQPPEITIHEQLKFWPVPITFLLSFFLSQPWPSSELTLARFTARYSLFLLFFAPKFLSRRRSVSPDIAASISSQTKFRIAPPRPSLLYLIHQFHSLFYTDRWSLLVPNSVPLANPPKRKKHRISKTLSEASIGSSAAPLTIPRSKMSRKTLPTPPWSI